MRRVLAFLACGLLTVACLAETTHDGPWPCATSDDCNQGHVCRRLSSATTLGCVARDACDQTSDCADGLTCTGGKCICPSTSLTCNGACVAPSSDPLNCGACNVRCTVAGQRCLSGVCQCDVGATICGSACVDISFDRTNCGACNHACDSSQTCSQGVCQ
jgi:hypothetical protein